MNSTTHPRSASGRAVVVMSVGLVLLLSATWVVSAHLVQHEPPDAVATGRSMLSCIGLALIALRSRSTITRSLSQLVRRPRVLLVSGILGVSAYSTASLSAIALVGASITNLIVAMVPTLTLVIGHIFLAHRHRPAAIAAVALTVVGAVVYALGSFHHKEVSPVVVVMGIGAGIIALCAASLYGLHYAHISRGHVPDDLLLGIFLFGTAGLLAMQAVSGRLPGLLSLPISAWLWLAVLGIAIYVPVYFLQHRLIHEKGAVFAATLSLAVPIVVRIENIALRQEPWPGPPEVIGMIVCLAGVAVIVRSGVRRGA
ncbi:DMT family transporter [Microbacterium rhizosphaerae]|uniref:DMT family transporter n=1 Tax=Microbacterium rhizosphaerae TaxID=1678237 RepID=A0ABZ0SL25_9MICO|nr:DMT family transporter [Microbacterium rhizosphaerae]WPR89323.1 DMT family transporter [Microbacterium rhizosphaerae]